ncbi:hypothetical protein [Paracoccus sp. ME4]|uniref:hypothetical protein n=1 Tax=Paracoccus sp. ME4 TaxID=3138066 RepID=UPI00398A934E
MEKDGIVAPPNFVGKREVLMQVIDPTAVETEAVLTPSDEWAGLNCATGQTCTMGPHGPGGSIQCQYCGAEPAPSDGLREAAAHANSWLRAALRCKEWQWDADQLAIAEAACNDLRIALSASPSASVLTK